MNDRLETLRAKVQRSRLHSSPTRLEQRIQDVWIGEYLERLRMMNGCRMKSRGRQFDLSLEFLVGLAARQQYRCAVSGILFEKPPAGRYRKKWPFSPSIDRINPGGEYVPENVRLVCLIVNYALNEFGDAALLKMSLGVVAQAPSG